MIAPTFTLTLTAVELAALRDLLVETAIAMDDDGNKGAFDRTPLKPLYRKVLAALAARRSSPFR
jgi:hypothetical protein